MSRATALFLLIVSFSGISAFSLPLEPLLPYPSQLINNNNAADATFCVHAVLSHCQASFNAQLNITGMQDWSDPQNLNSQIAPYYLQGVNGLIAVCNARQQFQACLGDMYSVCMSVPRFVSDGEDPNSASAYIQIFNQLQFDCNGGFVQATENYNCILDVWQRHGDDLLACYNAFNSTVATDPSTFCSATYQVEKCTRKPFQVYCGAEASWWQCERTRIGSGYDQLCPTSFCQVQQSSSSSFSAGRRDAVLEAMRGSSARNEVMSKLAEKARLRQKE